MLLFSIIFLIIPINSVSYSDCNVYGNCKPVTTITTTSVNYSKVNVNNSDFLDGFNSTNFCIMNYNNSGNLNVTGNLTGDRLLIPNGDYGTSTNPDVFINGSLYFGFGGGFYCQNARCIFVAAGNRYDILNEVGSQIIGISASTLWEFYINNVMKMRINTTSIYINNTNLNLINNANLSVNGTLNITKNATFNSDVIILGTLYGGSPVKISGGLNVSGNVIINSRINATNITISSLSESNCDIKSTTSGDLYCGTDQTGSGSGNSSWNQSIAEILFYSISNPLNFTNLSHTHPLSNITGIDENFCSGFDKVTDVNFVNGNLQIVCGADQTGTGGILNASTTTCSGNDKFSAYNNATGIFTCTADQTSAGGGDGTGSWVNSSTNTTTYVDVIANNSIYANNYRWMYPKGKSPLVESTFDDMNYLVTAYNRIITAPTINNADVNIISSLNFPSAATIYGDGGLVMTGDTATATNLFNLSYLDYYAIRLKLPTGNARTDMLGAFRTTTSVNMKTAFTGIFFYMNASNTTGTAPMSNWTGMICQANSCLSLNTTIKNDTNYHIFEIEGNNRMPVGNSSSWTFYIDEINFGSLSMSNSSQRVSTVGTWVENTDLTADTQRIDWFYYEIQRYF